MSIYINNTTFPISLINLHNNKHYNSFSNIQNDFKQSFLISDYVSYLVKAFKEEKNQHLITKLLVMFPYLFFSNAEGIKEINAKTYNLDEDEFSIYDYTRFLNVLNLRLNPVIIGNSIRDIKNSNYAEINYSNFVTQLFLVLYKYAFIEISESIYWNTENEIKQGLIFKELFIKEALAKHILSKKNANEFALYGAKIFLKNFNTSISKDDSTVLETKKELEIYLNHSSFSKVVYSIIDNNIKWVENLSSSKRNKLVRPLFYELVCKICYPEIYNEGIDSLTLVDKYRNFLKNY